jgi:hypothetical protein
MKKILLAVTALFLLSSCSLFKPKYGCPSDGRNIGAEKIAAGDPKATKAAMKAKYRGGRKSY